MLQSVVNSQDRYSTESLFGTVKNKTAEANVAVNEAMPIRVRFLRLIQPAPASSSEYLPSTTLSFLPIE